MNGKTILGKIKRNEPLIEEEIEYCRKWYNNLMEESNRQELLAIRQYLLTISDFGRQIVKQY